MDQSTLRRELLLGYHILDNEGQNSGIAGHLSARLPGADKLFAHTYGHGFDDVRADNIHQADFSLKTTDGGKVSPSLVIHTEIYKQRPDVCCILHTHSHNAVALSATGSNLEPVFQSGLVFHDDCTLYDNYDGIVENQAAGRALAEAIGPRRALLLQNHGLLIAARSIREAVICGILFDETAGIQLAAMAAGDLRLVPTEAAEQAKKFLTSDKVYDLRWNYLVRRASASRPFLHDAAAIAAE